MFFTKRVMKDTFPRSVQHISRQPETAFEFAYEWNTRTGGIEWYGNIGDRLGYPREELPATLADWERLVHPDDCPGTRDKRREQLSRQESFFEMYRVRCHNGRFVFVTEFGTALQFISNSCSKWVGLMRIADSEQDALP